VSRMPAAPVTGTPSGPRTPTSRGSRTDNGRLAQRRSASSRTSSGRRRSTSRPATGRALSALRPGCLGRRGTRAEDLFELEVELGGVRRTLLDWGPSAGTSPGRGKVGPSVGKGAPRHLNGGDGHVSSNRGLQSALSIGPRRRSEDRRQGRHEGEASALPDRPHGIHEQP
jgi:hypothetical protein